jgi:hypothetical protein
VTVEHVLDDADQLVAVARLLFDQRQQQQLEIAVAEHAAAATAPAAAAHLVPVTEEVAAAMSAERAPPRMALFVMAMLVLECMAVMVVLHGAEEQVMQAHG